MYNTPTDHVTRDIRDGVAKLGDLRFKVLDSAGLEAEASSGSVLSRTADMTKNVLARSQFALFMIDGRSVLLIRLLWMCAVSFKISTMHLHHFVLTTL